MAATAPDGRLSQLTRAASSVVDIGNTTMALSSLLRKRDLSLIWQLDPVAAPPRCVQKRLLGTAIDERSRVRAQGRRQDTFVQLGVWGNDDTCHVFLDYYPTTSSWLQQVALKLPLSAISAKSLGPPL